MDEEEKATTADKVMGALMLATLIALVVFWRETWGAVTWWWTLLYELANAANLGMLMLFGAGLIAVFFAWAMTIYAVSQAIGALWDAFASGFRKTFRGGRGESAPSTRPETSSQASPAETPPTSSPPPPAP